MFLFVIDLVLYIDICDWPCSSKLLEVVVILIWSCAEKNSGLLSYKILESLPLLLLDKQKYFIIIVLRMRH